MAQLGLTFDIIKPEIDESRLCREAPVAYAERLSRQKAAAVARSLAAEPALIISADTIVALDGELLGKPADADDARRMLRRLRNCAHQVVTAFTVHLLGSQPRRITRHARTIVRMRDYSDDEIDAYIASGDPFDKAGAYAIQNEDFRPVAGIEGSYSNVVGLPRGAVRTALEEIGFPLSDACAPAKRPATPCIPRRRLTE